MDKNFAGKEFIWWTGIVEDKQDPLKMGRCKVRLVGFHSDNKMLAPTSSLPWATPLFPINNTNAYAPQEGDMVLGFFLDGEEGQHPVMMGIFPNIPLQSPNPQKAYTDNRNSELLANSPRFPQSKTYNSDGTGITISEAAAASHYPINLDEPTTPRMARNDADTIGKTFIAERKNNVVAGVPSVNSTWSEPITEYAAKYPYNNVMESESGHIQEFDDTPGKERIQLAHRSGTFYEIYPDGSKVEKIVKDNYQIVMRDDHVYIMGKCLITVQGDAEIYVKKDAFMKVDGNFDVKVGQNFTVEVGSNYTVKVGEAYDITTGGNYTINAGGVYNATSVSKYTINAGGGFALNTIGSSTMNSSGNMGISASRVDLN